MPFDQTKNMLETLKYFCDSQITQSFSKNHSQVLTVCYLKESHSFEITYTETLKSESYPTIDSAAAAIEKAISSH
ncbi:hypothetical protein J7I93_22755 [Bacillus sp. ISL-47]|uniref:hypothetical protein n=1 Tax=Bacillus sp. ISL-47 TaxID=2819130 RepID=UPI001BE55BC9|nr:hypothetical protein [Bacillus sp. ISL-47]MBT2690960.1 hypothetical protein [Bacillus sp. ISL-47]MBT2706738.1 hypothetical protein [Pseudomonas sp. ISL-84]